MARVSQLQAFKEWGTSKGQAFEGHWVGSKGCHSMRCGGILVSVMVTEPPCTKKVASIAFSSTGYANKALFGHHVRHTWQVLESRDQDGSLKEFQVQYKLASFRAPVYAQTVTLYMRQLSQPDNNIDFC